MPVFEGSWEKVLQEIIKKEEIRNGYRTDFMMIFGQGKSNSLPPGANRTSFHKL